ncbi:MAG: PAS domain S-box protein [Sideroxyarcus sp.]|nr:PAS domain S-box protein [Sideroxyarcus sp.]
MTLLAAASRNLLVKSIKPFFPLLVYAAAAALLVSIYFSAFRQIEALILREKLNYLGATADEKVAQIATWRDTQTRIGESVSHNSLLAAEFELWLGEGGGPGMHRQRLAQRLGELRYVNGYTSVVLLDRRGKVQMSLPDGSHLGANDLRVVGQAMDTGKPLFSDIHRHGANEQDVSIDLIVPLTSARKGGGRVVGAVLLQIDPALYLYPVIRTWPTPSESAETLLARRDGEDALFLNELRHKKAPALTLRVPLSSQNLPTALALRGEQNTTDGIDYRGVPVVAEMRRVPGTDWIVISKVDRDELFEPITRLENWAMGIGILYVGIGGVLLLVWLYGQRARNQFLQVQHDAAVQRSMLLKHFEYLTRYANDIIVITDVNGNIVEANERALESYGYTREEFLTMQVPELRDRAEDPALYAAQMKRLQDAGELLYETRAQRKDGSTFPVEVSARMITVEGVKYMQGIIRDVSERKQVEEVLRKSESLLKETQKMAHIGSWELDLVNNILYWSDENYRIFEIDRDAFGASYEAFLNIVHPGDRELVNRAYTNSVRDRTPYNLVHRLQFADRRIKYVQEWCETFYDEAGKPLRSVGTTQDVTQQQMAFEALRKSSEEIESLYNDAPCGYHSLDADGIIVRINNTELEWLGYSRGEIVGKVHFIDLLAPDSRKAFEDSFAEFKISGFRREVEYEVLRKDGTSMHVLLSASLVCDSEGNYLMSRSTLFDITARKQAEMRLTESEARFRIMADNAPVMIWVADAQNGASCRVCNYYDRRISQSGDDSDVRGGSLCCSYFNQRWYQFTGLTPEQSYGCNWQGIVHPDDRKRCVACYAQAYRSRQPFRVEYRLRCSDGIYRWVEDSGVPRITSSGDYLGFVGVCNDITGRKLTDVLRGEMEHIDRLHIAGEMATGLAHELSQPLSAANSYLQACLHRMAGDDWDRDGLRKTVTLAQAQTERAGNIIGHLKKMVGKQKYERNLLDINALVKDSVNFLQHEAQEHGVAVRLDCTAAQPVLANKIEIEQVLVNLMKNAIDAMRDAPRRELTITTRDWESGFILVRVGDTGRGLASADLEKIFEPFHSSKKDGLGLGLSICRTLLDNYGGKIWAEHKADAGLEINFTLRVQ